MTKVKSRRLIKDAEDGDTVYCRRCMNRKKTTEFHEAVDHNLDKNGLLSICKDCVNEIFDGCMRVSENNISESIYKTCKMLNVIYLERVVDSVKAHIEKNQDKNLPYKIFSMYKSHLGKHMSINQGLVGTFSDAQISFSKDIEEELFEETEDTIKYMRSFWGEGLKQSDYEFLEMELANWKQSHSCDTYAELVLLREICYVQLDLRNNRVENLDTGSNLKKLLDAMKVSALDPAKANHASSGSGKETWGIFIKNIEETTPAEYFADKEIFKDVDDIDIYFQNYIRRPAINFYSSTRNLELLNSAEEDDVSTDEFLKEDATEEGD